MAAPPQQFDGSILRRRHDRENAIIPRDLAAKRTILNQPHLRN